MSSGRPSSRRGHYTGAVKTFRPWLVVPLAVAALAAACGRAPAPRPVILVTIDALRPDRLGPYGGPLPTPAFDRAAREGALVETATTPIGRTTPGIGSILTGLHPLAHGADGLGMPLPPKPRTLAELFRARGYAAAAFVSNYFLRPGLGFERGFEIYADPPARWEGDSGPSVVREALAWTETVKDRPFFLWVHILEPHWTYEPEARFAQAADPDWRGDDGEAARAARGFPPTGALLFGADKALPPRSLEHVRRMYDGEVLAADAALGALLDGLARQGILDRAVLLVGADHGESLGEHGYFFGHGEYAYEESLRVPLLVRAPGLVPAGARLAGNVGNADVAPTLLDLAGAPAAPESFDGLDLAPLLRAGGRQAAPARAFVHLSDDELVHAENPRRGPAGRAGRWRALREGTMVLVRVPRAAGGFDDELYDLAADPRQRNNLAAARPDDVRRMARRLDDELRPLLARFAASGAAEAPEAPDLERLKGLGYAR